MAKLNKQQQEIFSDLSLKEKVAIFLIQIGEDASSNIFSNMDIRTITELSQYIATSKQTDKHISSAILEEFYALLQSSQQIKAGGLEYAKEILLRTFGPAEANKILEHLTKQMDGAKSFSYLEKVKPAQLADFIVTEHPQTIALILAHMEPSNAAEVISSFPDNLRSEVTIRMANLGDISPSIIKVSANGIAINAKRAEEKVMMGANIKSHFPFLMCEG